MKLTMDEYQQLAMRTCITDGRDKLNEAALGLIGETDEIVDVHKKHKYQSAPDADIPRRQFAEEIGDVLWYMAELADGLGINMSELSPDEFDALDRKARKSKRAQPKIEYFAVGASSRAGQIYRNLQQNDMKKLGVEYRRMLLLLAKLARKIGYSMEEIAQLNIEKLKKRYPGGFDAGESMKRYEK